jgi:hypothetical protein
VTAQPACMRVLHVSMDPCFACTAMLTVALLGQQHQLQVRTKHVTCIQEPRSNSSGSALIGRHTTSVPWTPSSPRTCGYAASAGLPAKCMPLAGFNSQPRASAGICMPPIAVAFGVRAGQRLPQATGFDERESWLAWRAALHGKQAGYILAALLRRERRTC